MSNRVRVDLAEGDLRIVTEILSSRMPDRPVFVFGSRATGTARRRSDLDLAIGGPAPLTLRQRALLNDDFSESDLPIFVDVVDLNAITPEFRKRIERDFVPLQAGTARAEVVTA